MNTSKKATLFNTIATFASGMAILLFNKKLMSIFEIENNTPFLVIGSIITFFSLTMLIEIKKQRSLAILWIIIQDILFVIASIIVLIVRPFEISNTGYLLIELFLIPIIFFIIYQSIGLARMDRKPGTKTKLMVFKRKVKATKKDAWNIISDIENYHKVASNIDGVKIISGDGKGMVRSCSHGKDSWFETCTLWEVEKEYAFVVDTKAPDYPYPFKSLMGIWKVDSIEQNITEITMIFEFEYTKGFQSIILHPLLKTKFTKVCIEIMDKWQAALEQ
ncbi:type II toxin-antitoxin system RatA family toxin [Flavivirga eckloniae]|nr:SRPBCC family protein [Flavivirga eckloniae]